MEGATSIRLLMVSMTGMRRTTSGELFMNPLAIGTTIATRSSRRLTLPPDQRTSSAVSWSSAPVRTMPALSTNMAATVTVALEEKPESASGGDTTRVSSNATIVSSEVTSMEIHWPM